MNQDLRTAAAALEAAPDETGALFAAARAVVAAAGESDRFREFPKSERHRMYRTLLLQPGCDRRPLIFAHEAASAITAGNRNALPPLVVELLPVLQELLDQGEEIEGFGNLVLFLLVVRAWLGKAVAQERIARLHLRWFDRFGAEDLALPYSVMFNADSFGRNRQEILTRYPDRTAVPKTSAFGPSKLLFFEWLSGRPWFTAADNSDLEEFLSRYLPGSSEETAAARTLAMRHLRPGSVLNPTRLEALSLGSIAEPAAAMARVRAALPKRSDERSGADRIDQRLYQVFQAGWTRTTLYLPALNTGQRRVRVAVCVSGQLRGYRAALASWRRSLLAQVDAHFFVHVWESIGRSDAQPFRYVLPFEGRHFPDAYRQVAQAEGYDALRAQFPTLFAGLAVGERIEAEELRTFYGTEHVVAEDDRAERFVGFSNQQKMHYKIHAADQLAREVGEFDLRIRLRPDLPVLDRGFDWRDMRTACVARPVLYAEASAGLHYNKLMIGDQFALAAPPAMTIYADTWKTFPGIARCDLGRCPREFGGHVSLAVTTWLQGIGVEKAPIRFGRLREAEAFRSTDILAALETDADGSDASARLLAAVRRDLSAH